MRKLILSILLASAAVSPALAQDRGSREDRATAKAERQQAREERGKTQQVQQAQPNRTQEVQPAQPNRTQQVEARQQRQAQGAGGGFDRSRSERGNRGTFDGQQQQPQQQPQQQQLQGRSGFDRSQAGARQQGQSYQGQRYQGQASQSQTYQGQRQRYQGQASQSQTYQGQRQSYQGQRYQGQQSAGSWDRNWRNNQRYDWRNYRNRHRSTFHLGIYYDPFGYGYRSFDIGYRLQPNYFGQQYWIDPALYQLPYPPPGTQWVRYWNDALLVDMYSGEVVDVIHNFFW